jgi:leader peptidase (prepilin peptidase)/N-methyltransferase
VVLTAIDLEFRIIPDRFSLGNWGVAIAASLVWGIPGWSDALIGGAVGFGLFFSLSLFYEKVRKIEGLGMGDVKMMGWVGAWLGFLSVPLVILVASLTGLFAGVFVILSKKGDGMKTALPFGPFIALGAYVAWVLQSLHIQIY